MSKVKSLTFRNVTLRYVDMRKKEESMPFVRLHLSADLTDTVCEEFGWAKPGDGITKGDYGSLVRAQHLILTPNDKALRGRELQIECSELSDFKFVGEKDQDTGAVVSAQLRFIARSNQEGAGAAIEAYWRAVGDSDAQMKLAYTATAVQEKLELGDVATDEAADPDDFSDADQPGSPALASHQEMRRKRAGIQ